MKIYKIKVNGKTYKVELEAMEEVASKSNTTTTTKPEVKETKPTTTSTGEGNKVLSPIQGTVIAVKVNVGDKVKKGQVIAVIEAMKLENDVVSTFEGEVSEVLVSKGNTVASKDPLIIVK